MIPPRPKISFLPLPCICIQSSTWILEECKANKKSFWAPSKASNRFVFPDQRQPRPRSSHCNPSRRRRGENQPSANKRRFEILFTKQGHVAYHRKMGLPRLRLISKIPSHFTTLELYGKWQEFLDPEKILRISLKSRRQHGHRYPILISDLGRNCLHFADSSTPPTEDSALSFEGSQTWFISAFT